ncbi:hypothetical protein [Tenacibaculum finnmarkense]|uniref:hypothetical protein n=1 Tax=Tenacibaculum finnmarkense TaxID=2781243 RepID=UPI001EFB5BCE|nr:hypothetical protein [Tenacibaculum finnmarkense]MCG8207864.1 hypothetical protein [Tenacibaculum finnmarkense genomovar finnmarkense]MCG8724343.1 hypothetical protein [Tenacibaculum finnmarkense]MCG8766060.1 hypothetical protein [Tenacibaculum finnmarkense]MCG8779027.1 hypothetical protein [Tenacibaculum finnmarkense]MCM8907531.1 hypothetical protein [Tenacibaculum finnmarkense genomovar finnmarkense]
MSNKALEIVLKKLTLLENWKRKESELDENLKEDLNSQIANWRRIKEDLEYQILSPDEKQGKRILQIAKFRQRDWGVKDQLNEINLYSKIREVIPYIMAVSYKINMEEKHLTEDLLGFCESQLEIIDSSSYKRKIIFPSKEEIEKTFKSYKERIKPNKIPSLKVYNQPEVNKKIEELYQMFLNLSR